MNKTCVIFGSSTGVCQDLAGRIAEKLGGVEVLEAGNISAADLADYTNLILGTSTWGAGEMQDDWYEGIKAIKEADLNGKVVALFGCGDCEGYSDTFCGGLAELYNAAKESGAKIVGEVSTDGYTFDDSEAVVDGKFVGLALDEVNEEGKTEERINAWIEQIKPEL